MLEAELEADEESVVGTEDAGILSDIAETKKEDGQ